MRYKGTNEQIIVRNGLLLKGKNVILRKIFGSNEQETPEGGKNTYEKLRKLSSQNITKIEESNVLGQGEQRINLREEYIEVLMGNLNKMNYLQDRILYEKMTLRSVK